MLSWPRRNGGAGRRAIRHSGRGAIPPRAARVMPRQPADVRPSLWPRLLPSAIRAESRLNNSFMAKAYGQQPMWPANHLR
jgi:hypothetical protein